MGYRDQISPVPSTRGVGITGAGAHTGSGSRYSVVAADKACGATYTPGRLAEFVASEIVAAARLPLREKAVRILDPAVGDGQLLVSLLTQLRRQKGLDIELCGFDISEEAAQAARARLRHNFPGITVDVRVGDFLELALRNFEDGGQGNLFRQESAEAFDLIIANPPYVRTQILGASRAQDLARSFGLSGRIDLCFAFMLGIARVLKPGGVAGVIVSNRFMTTKSGSPVREAIRRQFDIVHVWDLGDTKLFDAAVLPSVLVLRRMGREAGRAPRFTSIYQTTAEPSGHARDPIDALSQVGVVQVPDGRRFRVERGELGGTDPPGGVWRITSHDQDLWRDTVTRHTWSSFRRVGKVRVGVKTCADHVFIRSDWQDLPPDQRPELLKPVITHHAAGRFRSRVLAKNPQILYPHEVIQGHRQPVDLSRYPRARAYLERHRDVLESREYVVRAGRRWYEIWVPQDPAAWSAPKLVFRDIVDVPTFWLDETGAVVNGDCYWLTAEDPKDTDLLWLAMGVANSTFIEAFYDRHFHNKLYAGRRRFITQYVERFPLPDPRRSAARAVAMKAREAYRCADASRLRTLQAELDELVWRAFGLPLEEIRR